VFGFSAGAFVLTLLLTIGAIAVVSAVALTTRRSSLATPAAHNITEEDLRALEAEAEGIKCEYCGSVLSGSRKS
jgi:hypothetical protein